MEGWKSEQTVSNSKDPDSNNNSNYITTKNNNNNPLVLKVPCWHLAGYN